MKPKKLGEISGKPNKIECSREDFHGSLNAEKNVGRLHKNHQYGTPNEIDT